MTDKFHALLDRLIEDGEAFLSTAVSDGRLEYIPDREPVVRWTAELALFRAVAGSLIEPWRKPLEDCGATNFTAQYRYAVICLKTIRNALDEGYLNRYRDLILAETFSDLMSQADYLYAENFYLAAGVLYRAVLEEHLRNLCDREHCLPTTDRPTISDFNAELYRAKIYSKTVMHQVTALAAIGNDAAHNKPELTMESVGQLKVGLAGILATALR